jgi:hypothetical protein
MIPGRPIVVNISDRFYGYSHVKGGVAAGGGRAQLLMAGAVPACSPLPGAAGPGLRRSRARRWS